MNVRDAAEPPALPTAPGAETAATIRIDADRETGRIDRHIYGHFLESSFFGNIEGGLLDEQSPLATPGPGPLAGARQDVIEACRELGIPILRWPGGNFASSYHWTDGVGPRERRPRRLDLNWGGEESNRFGTDEFLAWCSAVGAEPYLVHSCRDVEEAARWVEYTNYAGDTHYTRLRADNGHPEPYQVRYWGVGNEVYGPWQMGHREPEQYAAAAREHARFMRLVDPSLRLVAVGAPWHQEQWTRPLLERAGDLFDYVSLHLYGASTHLYTAAQGDDDYQAVVAQPLHFEREIARYADLVHGLAQECGVSRPLALAIDEWNIRHLEPAQWPEPLPGPAGGTAARDLAGHTDAQPSRLRVNRWSPRTLADALFYAGVFHALHRLSGLPVAPRMANTVNLLNANAPLAVRDGGLVKASTYHVWDLYQNHTGTVALPVQVDGPSRWEHLRLGDRRDGTGGFHTSGAVVPYLDAVATRTADRRSLSLVLINRHRTAAIEARLMLDGATGGLPRRARVHDIGAGITDMLAVNTFDDPELVTLRDRGSIELADGRYRFPAHSVTLLSFDLGTA